MHVKTYQEMQRGVGRRTRACMLLTSRSTGSGGNPIPYDSSCGWIMVMASPTVSLFRYRRQYAVSSGLFPNTYAQLPALESGATPGRLRGGLQNMARHGHCWAYVDKCPLCNLGTAAHAGAGWTKSAYSSVLPPR